MGITADPVSEYAAESASSFLRTVSAERELERVPTRWVVLVRDIPRLAALLNDLWANTMQELQEGGRAETLQRSVERGVTAAKHMVSALGLILETADFVEKEAGIWAEGGSAVYRLMAVFQKRVEQGEIILQRMSLPRKPLTPERATEIAQKREARERGEKVGETADEVIARLDAEGTL